MVRAMARYLPLLRLAASELADVYLGVLRGHAGFDRPVIMKRAFAGIRESEETAQAMLIEEARAALALHHPHVVGALELIELEEGLVLVFEYVPGVSAHALITHLARDDGRVDWPLACRLVADAASGIAYAHRMLGRAHGDLSARNVMISDEGFARVIDFSLESDRVTPHFASPEVARGQPASPKSDVFALGLLLHALIDGAPAFDGESPKEIMAAIARDAAPPLDAPPAVAAIVGSALIKEPGFRPNAEELAESLGSLAGSAGSRRQLRTLLEAEMGPVLRKRRERVANVLAGQIGPAGALRTDTRTMAALESALDGELPELGATLVRSTRKG